MNPRPGEIWPPPPRRSGYSGVDVTDVERRVVRVVSEMLDRDGVRPATGLEPRDLDSFEDVELVLRLEEEFDIAITDDDAIVFFTTHQPAVRDLVEWVAGYLASVG